MSARGLELWHAAVLGLVEGVTEYLPVSSTGHLILTVDLLGVRQRVDKDAIDAFNVVIQGGAILAVVGLYLPRFVAMVRGLLGRDPAGLRLLARLAVAFLPATGLAFVLRGVIKEHLFHAGPVVGALMLGGVVMIVLDRALIRAKRAAPGEPPIGKTIEQMSPRDALIIGLCQIAALWPGTSRSMSTIVGGVVAGLRPAAAAEFSFLLGVPVLLAATGYEVLKEFKGAADGQPSQILSLGVGPVVLGLVVATLSAAAAVRWLIGFLNRHGLVLFGVYRLALGGVLIGLVAAGLVQVRA